MAGSISVGGKVIATHTGPKGAGTVSLGTNIRLSEGGGIQDSSGNDVLTESSGSVSFGNVIGGVPAGAIMSFATSSFTDGFGTVTGAPAGWIVCNGAPYAIADFGDLYTAIGSQWVTAWTNSESITTGDYRKNSSGVIYIATSTGTTSGTDVEDDAVVTWSASSNFLVPDLRGAFLRGEGPQTYSNNNYNGGSVGDKSIDTFKSHTHSVDYYSSGGGNNSPYGGSRFVSTFTGSTNATGGTETKPFSSTILYCIKY